MTAADANTAEIDAPRYEKPMHHGPCRCWECARAGRVIPPDEGRS